MELGSGEDQVEIVGADGFGDGFAVVASSGIAFRLGGAMYGGSEIEGSCYARM